MRIFFILFTAIITVTTGLAGLSAPLWTPEGADLDVIIGGCFLMSLASLGLNVIACHHNV